MANLIWHPRNGDSVCELYTIHPVPSGYQLLLDGNPWTGTGSTPFVFSSPVNAATAAQAIEDEACEMAPRPIRPVNPCGCDTCIGLTPIE